MTSLVCQNSIFIKCADDATILNFFRQPSDDNFQVEVNNVLHWKLDFNSDKRFVMDIVTKQSLSCSPVRVSNDLFFPLIHV